MLSEEEKKAIERLEKRIKDNEDYKTTQVWLTDDIVAVDTVLNLITKLQKENEELKATVNKQSIDISNNLLELQQKDRQIDLMAELVYKRFKAELLLEYGFENEEQLKQYKRIWKYV